MNKIRLFSIYSIKPQNSYIIIGFWSLEFQKCKKNMSARPTENDF